MYDAHLIVDIIAIVVAVLSAYLAARREFNTRISAIEVGVAEIKGALKALNIIK